MKKDKNQTQAKSIFDTIPEVKKVESKKDAAYLKNLLNKQVKEIKE
ncbi:hypothetical protein [Mycoplasmopsis agassizii]|nr:hypothetical protein [Mycoplasmopsis agassizii]SMC20337.1 hypothetical protein SAMN02745179_01014 [Mycoplasmopsis agassizii]